MHALAQPMRGVHEKSHANRVGYLSHSSIIAHYPNNSIISLRNSLQEIIELVDRIH